MTQHWEFLIIEPVTEHTSQFSSNRPCQENKASQNQAAQKGLLSPRFDPLPATLKSELHNSLNELLAF